MFKFVGKNIKFVGKNIEFVRRNIKFVWYKSNYNIETNSSWCRAKTVDLEYSFPFIHLSSPPPLTEKSPDPPNSTAPRTDTKS